MLYMYFMTYIMLLSYWLHYIFFDTTYSNEILDKNSWMCSFKVWKCC